MIHISHQHKAVVVPYRPDLANLFPHAKRIDYEGEEMIVLPHGLDETRLLRNLDMNVPAPIVEHYEFPGDKRPFDKQVATCALMTMHPRAFVLNKMGTGKTKSCLWSFDWLKRTRKAKKMLVVAPLSTIDFVWGQEIMKTLPGCKYQILYGSAEKRLDNLNKEADVYIVNHDGLKVKPLFNRLMQRHDIDVICFDEAAVFRNARTEMAKAAQALTRGRTWVWAMTGSPTPTAPTDAFGLLKVIMPEKCPRSFVHFRQETMLQVSQFKWVPRSDAATTVSKMLQPSVCFSLDDVTELPPLVERMIPVQQGKRQRDAYKDMADKASVQLKEGRITAQNGGIALNKLLQISAGYVYDDNGHAISLDNEHRTQTMLDLIESTDRKVIVFSAYKHLQKGIKEALDRHHIHNALVNGDVGHAARQEIFNAFQNTDKYDVLNAHPECMAHGLTLTAADTIIWFGPLPSLEIYEQANARIRRVGQTAKQQVCKLHGTPAERVMYARLDQRRNVQESILDLLAEITKEK